MTESSINMLVTELNRVKAENKKLQVEVEGLRKEQANENRCENEVGEERYICNAELVSNGFELFCPLCNLRDTVKALQSRLSDLLTAAEPISQSLRNFEQFDMSEKDGIVDGHIMDKYKLDDITLGDLRALSAAVDRVREEK